MMKWQVVIFLLSCVGFMAWFAFGDTKISQQAGSDSVILAHTGSGDINFLITLAKKDYYKEIMQQAATFTSDEPEVKRLLIEAKTAFDNKKFDVAEKLYNQASDQDVAMMAKQLQEIARKRLISASQAKSVNGKIKMTESAYQEAANYYQQAAKLLPEGFEKDKGDYLNNAGIAFFYAGEYQQALPVYEEALKIREQVGKQEDYAESLSNLASLYQVQEQYNKQAEPLYQKSLQIYEQVFVLSKQHLTDYASTLNNLGNLYSSQGQYEQAFPLLQKSLKIREETLGKQHQDYATSLVSLAELYRGQSKYEQAKQRYQEALEIYERVLGKQHRYYAITLHNLALLYDSQGQYKQALPLLQQAFKIQTEVLGEKHPDSQSIAENLRNVQDHFNGKYQVIVKQVSPDKPAAQLGIQAGDIFTHYDQQPILGSTQFILGRDKEPTDGAAKELTVLRDGKTLTFQLKPGTIGVELGEKLKSEP